jgi:hypothetical protein
MTLGKRNNMKNRKTNLIAYAVFVLAWSLILYGFIISATQYSSSHPKEDKPGISEIRTIAEENNLKYRDVSSALKGPADYKINLPKIILSQTIAIGFTLGIFVLIRKLVAKFTE